MNHLLIVDDSAVDRELARQLVERRPSTHAEFASNGLEALEHLEQATPLAVLTDLQMPEMDGLAFVRAARKRFPTIPIVLMTAFGSEEIALEALVEGASDYVSKHRLAVDLPRVLDAVLVAAAGDRRHDEVTRCLRYKQLRYALAGDLALIAPLVDQLQQATVNLGIIDRADQVRLARCLAEALRNAITHGQGQDGSVPMEVEITAELTPGEARYTIRDRGSGFDPRNVPDPRESPQKLTEGTGRGLSLIRLFMDDVTFNSTGNEITLVKRRT
ncbi:MAG: response regulator [Pirellulaceae bacterium]|nr:response regulator [Pirellulaceae bacterium]